MACCVPDGSNPSLTFYYTLEKGETTVLQSVNGITQSITQRPVFSDISLTNKIGEYYAEKLYSNTFSSHVSTVALSEGIISYNGFNNLNKNGVLPSNTSTILPIVYGMQNFLCKNGFVYVISTGDIRRVNIYFSESLCK